MTEDKKVVDLQAARRRKREKTGWTIEEIRQSAAKRLEETRRLGQFEPPNLASGGDMGKILEDDDDDEIGR
jgi:hypothetical protein